VRYSFEGNWMLKQPNIITLEKVVSKAKISQMYQLFLKKENGMTHKKLRRLKLKTGRVVLMCVLAFGKMKSVKSNRSSNDPLSSLSISITTVNFLPFLISFFVWDKTRRSSTFALKI
jgi:hypothetical protein